MDTTWPEQIDDMHGAFLRQAFACAGLGSAMYGELLQAMADDYVADGVVRALVAGSSDKPVHDAIPLRLVGSLHRIVLSGNDDGLAAHYPSAGGTFTPDSVRTILASLEHYSGELRQGLTQQVQTNEVGRSVVHLSLARWLGTIGHGEFVLREVGTSAGLNLSFDKYFADSGTTTMGESSSRVRFTPSWFTSSPPQGVSAMCVDRSGSDPYPIDVVNSDEALKLRSFVWPDQTERFERISAAIDIAQIERPRISTASADVWLNEVLHHHDRIPTVVFHSIVWQYLNENVRDGLRDALRMASNRATDRAPLIWARMEPSGAVASVDVTIFTGAGQSHDIHLADVGYHGQHLNWLI